MRTSEQISELAAALAAAQGEIENAVADTENPHFKSTYADLASVRAAIKGPLSKNGLAIVQTPTTVEGKTALTSRMMHKSGQWIEDTCVLLVDKPTMQGMGSAITYMKRYTLTAMTGLAEKDDDGNAAEVHPAKKTKPIGKPPVTPVGSVLPAAQGLGGPAPDQQPKAGVTTKQRGMLWARLMKLDYSDEDAKAFLQAHSGKAHSADWTRSDFDKVLGVIEHLEKNNPQSMREPGEE